MPILNISIIIPCYNEEAVIEETYKRVKRSLTNNGYTRHEIIFINDGSRDRTLLLLEEISQRDTHVKVISFSRNFGHQPAVSCGINYCTGDVAIIIDADLQDPPELFHQMIQKYEEEDCNVVYGVRRERQGESFFKRCTAKLFYRMINSLSEVPIPLDTGDFRLIDERVIREFKQLKEKNKYIRGLISWIGFKQMPIYYTREPRFAGETKYPVSKMIKFATTGLLYFTRKPLKLATTLGFSSILIGFILVIYVFVSKFSRQIDAVPGWASTLIIIIFFLGVQLLTIGVMGEYIGSIFSEVKERPEYIIEKKINF
ncbi:MAG: glycosyltransferase family 2 protein [Candidatus Jettenia sp.]|nr:MAG: glycosyltransferase family 2 protein [Candidatus Jettenia sp.]